MGYDGTFPGPTIAAKKDVPITVRQMNELPRRAPGAGYVPRPDPPARPPVASPYYDGYANDLTSPRQYKDYHYANDQPRRTLWYHDHGVHHTSENIYMGLAAQYHLHDPAEAALRLPRASSTSRW